MRCAITGYGVVSSLGTGVEPFREALRSGRRNLSWLEGMPVPHGKGRFALADFPASCDRSARMALKAIQEAMEVSGCDIGDGYDAGLVIGSVWAETQSAESNYARLKQGEISAGVLHALRRYPAGSLVDGIGETINIRGPRLIFNNACASSNIALGQGLDLIRRGICRMVVVIGVDRFSLPGLWGAERSGFVGRDLQSFDCNRKGTVLGEGSAVLIIEAENNDSRDRAKAWLEGYACVCEPGAAAITLGEDGIGLQMSMRRALADAGRTVDEIEYVNAHSPGTPLIDLVECRAIAALWKEQPQPPAINATKTHTGHMSGASAIAEAIATIVQIEEGFLHGNLGFENPDPKIPVPVLGPVAQKKQVQRAISNACGGGGLNTSVVIAAKELGPVATSRRAVKSRVVLSGAGTLQAPGRAEDDKELDWFDVHRWIEKETNIANMNRSAWIGGSVGVMAIQAAGLRADPAVLPPEEVAVIGGVWLGGWTVASSALCEGLQYDPVQIFPSTALNNFGAHIASMMVCRKFGFTGPTHTVCGSLSSGLQAVAVAHGLLECGRSQAAVVMGYDSDDIWLRRAANWMRECQLLHNFVEGGASVILEREETAQQRGAKVLAVVHATAQISSTLRQPEEIERAAESMLCQLQPTTLHRIVLCGPADSGMRALAQELQQKTGTQLELPGPVHSLAGDGLLAIARHLDGENTLILAGESGSSQVGVIILGAAESKATD
ncbi:MAG TPA: beta-ketoacyl synthase N-terminal-like domain-containing protein [Candidatus Angelobacter sp.]|nr:beta-ketoacyl synthase N-terminal-like domain-containing protein [Candidatus Angelobacter sp.]